MSISEQCLFISTFVLNLHTYMFVFSMSVGNNSLFIGFYASMLSVIDIVVIAEG